MNHYIIIPVVTFIINVCTMSYIAALDYRKSVIRSYLLFSGVITLWILMGWAFYLPVEEHLRAPLCRLSSLFWFFTGFTFMNLTYEFLERERDLVYRAILVVACASVAVTVSTDLVVSGFIVFPWGWRFGQGPLFNPVTVLTIFIPVLFSGALYIARWRSSTSKTRRTQMAFMVYGIILSLAGGAAMQYLIPNLPGFENTVRYTAPASSILSVFMFYAIIRYRFLSPGVRDAARELFSSIGDGIVIMNNEGRVLQMNAAAARMLGADADNHGSLRVEEKIDNYSSFETYTAFQTSIHIEGNKRSVLITQSEIVTDGAFGGRILIINDITDITRMNAAIRESEAHLRMISENVSDAIWILDLATLRMSYVSPSVSNILGWTPEEFISQPLEYRIVKEYLDNALSELKEELDHDAERDPLRFRAIELKELCADGTYMETEIKVAFIRDNDGKPTALLGVTRDITRRKRLERELNESLSALRVRTDMLEKELVMAQSIQRALLPDGPPLSADYLIGYKYLPLEAVGGDYFDIRILDEGGLSVFLGDVSGHGVSAALFLSLLKSESGKLLRTFARDPGGYLCALNGELLGNLYSYFITAVYGIIYKPDPAGCAVLSLSSAGHPPPVLYRRAKGTAEYLDVRGKVLGIYRNPVYSALDVPLETGDRVFFYTDGLPEVMNEEGELLGFDGLLDILLQTEKYMDVHKALDETMNAVTRYRGKAPISDDTVIIGIEVL